MKKTRVFKPFNLGKQALPYLLAVFGAFLAAGFFLWLMGFNVLQAYQTILFTSFKSRNGFIQTLLKFIPLILTALAFTIPMKASKFNIGSEGQLVLRAQSGAVIAQASPPALLGASWQIRSRASG